MKIVQQEASERGVEVVVLLVRQEPSGRRWISWRFGGVGGLGR